MSLTSLAIRFAAPLPDPEAFQRYLFIGPHPDDIEIGAGATAAKLAHAGKQICFLICTDGRYGDGNAAGLHGDELAAARKEEAIASAAKLGVTDVRFLDLCDGGFYTEAEMLNGIAAVIGDFQPQVIFAPDPDIRSECHPDHRNTGSAAKKLACLAPYPGIMAHYGAAAAPVEAAAFYMTCNANRYVKTAGYLPQQLDAIFACHRTQYPAGSGDAKAISLYLKIRSADFGLRAFSTAAEGFRVLGKTQMHCLPEADLL